MADLISKGLIVSSAVDSAAGARGRMLRSSVAILGITAARITYGAVMARNKADANCMVKNIEKKNQQDWPGWRGLLKTK